MSKTVKEIKEHAERCKWAANDEYNDHTSPHYRDNERFRWAVKTINEARDREIAELEQQNPNL